MNGNNVIKEQWLEAGGEPVVFAPPGASAARRTRSSVANPARSELRSDAVDSGRAGSEAAVASAAKSAREEIERVRQQAIEEGRQQGLKLGMADAERAVASRLVALRSAAGALEQAVRDLREMELTQLADLTYVATSRLLGSVWLDARTVRDFVVTTLRELGHQGPVRVHLHPDDAASLDRLLADDKANELDGVEWHPDATLAGGGCKVTVGAAMVDASLETQLRILRETLTHARKEPPGARPS